jgi:hypothetical protein
MENAQRKALTKDIVLMILALDVLFMNAKSERKNAPSYMNSEKLPFTIIIMKTGLLITKRDEIILAKYFLVYVPISSILVKYRNTIDRNIYSFAPAASENRDSVASGKLITKSLKR